MPTTRITPPTAEPVTLAEAKLHLRVDGSDEDTLIASLISAARQAAEHRLGRTLMPSTWRLSLDAFPNQATIRLQWPEIVAVTSVKYYDADGVLQTWGSINYHCTAASQRLCLAEGTMWPITQARADAVEITYTAGWANAAAVPDGIKAWIKLALTDLFEQRSRSSDKPAVPQDFADGLLDAWRVYGGGL